MFTNLKQQQRQMQQVALASAILLCAGYWVGFSQTPNNEHDPIKMASFYMEIGN